MLSSKLETPALSTYRPRTPRKGLVEKRFPDGRRQFVRFDLDGEHVVVDNVQTVSGPSQEL